MSKPDIIERGTSIADIIAKPATDNERAMYRWAVEQAGLLGSAIDESSFITGRRLQSHWQAFNRSHA